MMVVVVMPLNPQLGSWGVWKSNVGLSKLTLTWGVVLGVRQQGGEITALDVLGQTGQCQQSV